jgi:hypothetical protein
MKRVKLLLRRSDSAEAREAEFYMQLLIFAVALIALVVLAMYLPEAAPAAAPLPGMGG